MWDIALTQFYKSITIGEGFLELFQFRCFLINGWNYHPQFSQLRYMLFEIGSWFLFCELIPTDLHLIHQLIKLDPMNRNLEKSTMHSHAKHTSSYLIQNALLNRQFIKLVVNEL